MSNTVSVVRDAAAAAFAAPSSCLIIDSYCPLCCEDKPSTEMCVLSNCGHHDDASCHGCLVKWVEKAEASGQTAPPACPFCRVVMTEEDTLEILGRPFQPRKSAAADATNRNDNGNDNDEFTQQWLDSHTKPCPGCGARIEKLPDGCDLMECLCGYQFCYNCGSPGAQCSCTPGLHYFWDNILDQNAIERDMHLITGRFTPIRAAHPTAQAPRDEETGQINLLAHIKKRQGELVRNRRQFERRREAQEVESMDQVTMSAKWLFSSSSNKSSLRILGQQMLRDRVRHERSVQSVWPGYWATRLPLDDFLEYGGWLYKNRTRATTLEQVICLWEQREEDELERECLRRHEIDNESRIEGEEENESREGEEENAANIQLLFSSNVMWPRCLPKLVRSRQFRKARRGHDASDDIKNE